MFVVIIFIQVCFSVGYECSSINFSYLVLGSSRKFYVIPISSTHITMLFRQTFTEYLPREKLEPKSSLCFCQEGYQLHTRSNPCSFIFSVKLEERLWAGWREGWRKRATGHWGQSPWLPVIWASNLAEARWAFLSFDGCLGITLFTRLRLPRGLLHQLLPLPLCPPVGLCTHSFQPRLALSLKGKFRQTQHSSSPLISSGIQHGVHFGAQGNCLTAHVFIQSMDSTGLVGATLEYEIIKYESLCFGRNSYIPVK